MATRGAIAKNIVEDKIREAFGADFVGIQDKKLYVQADENGEKVQIAISLTCPKVPLGIVEDGINFESGGGGGAGHPPEFKPAEVTPEETENIRKLLAELGL